MNEYFSNIRYDKSLITTNLIRAWMCFDIVGARKFAKKHPEFVQIMASIYNGEQQAIAKSPKPKSKPQEPSLFDANDIMESTQEPEIDIDTNFKNLDECLKFAKKIYKNAQTKPQIDINLWIRFVTKKFEIRKRQNKGVTKALIQKHFKEVFELTEYGLNAQERIEVCIVNEWQGLFFHNEKKELLQKVKVQSASWDRRRLNNNFDEEEKLKELNIEEVS